jgi:hypothetical protein
MNLRILILIAGAGAALWSVQRWRQAVQLGLVLLIFEGAVRKWVFPGAQDLIYFAKDVLFLGAYAGFLKERGWQRYRTPSLPALYGALALGVLFGLLQVFNPNLPNLLVGVLGFKAYFFYVPLLFILPAVFPTDAALTQALRRYLLLAIPVCLLGVAQFFSPASSRLNTYARSAEDFDVVTFGSSTHVRVTATFSFISGFTAYLLAMSILLLAWLAATRWRFRGNKQILAALGLVLLAMLMTGSRGPLLSFTLILPLYWLLAIVRERQSGAIFLRLVAGMIVIGVLVSQLGGEAVSAFRGRAFGTTENVVERMLVPVQAPFHVLPEVGLAGLGIGATHQAAMSLAGGKPFFWLRGLAVEVESGRVMIELGPLGFLLVFFSRLYLVFFAFQQIQKLRMPFHRSLATACCLFFLTQLVGNVVFDVTVGVYYWAFAGLLMTAIRLDRVAVRAESQARAQARAQASLPPEAPEAAPSLQASWRLEP